jgi:hypothetical protein
MFSHAKQSPALCPLNHLLDSSIFFILPLAPSSTLEARPQIHIPSQYPWHYSQQERGGDWLNLTRHPAAQCPRSNDDDEAEIMPGLCKHIWRKSFSLQTCYTTNFRNSMKQRAPFSCISWPIDAKMVSFPAQSLTIFNSVSHFSRAIHSELELKASQWPSFLQNIPHAFNTLRRVKLPLATVEFCLKKGVQQICPFVPRSSLDFNQFFSFIYVSILYGYISQHCQTRKTVLKLSKIELFTF